MHNKASTIPNHHSNRTLKSILNNIKIPLSKYIGTKPPTNDKTISYFDKLRTIMNNNYYGRYSDLCEMNDINVIRQVNSDVSLERRKVYRGTQHRWKQPCVLNKIKYGKRDAFKHQNQKQMVTETNNEMIRKRIISNVEPTTKHINSINIYTNSNSNGKVKQQLINYNSFSPILSKKRQQLGKQQNPDTCQKWGKIQLQSLLGSGANATVREGIQYKTGIKYAVKIYEKYKLLDQKKRNRVYSQIQLLKWLPQHQNVICMHQAFQDKRQIHVIFQYLSTSVTLHQYFRNKLLYLQQKQIMKIFGEMVKGIWHLHEHGIAHRDVKPDNVLISFDEDGQIIVKIIDFGFATAANKAELHCGTPNFMAPQLLERNVKYCPLGVDVWALGVTLFYLSQARYPFKGYDEKDLFKSIRLGSYELKKTTSPNMVELIQKMLKVNPSQRASVNQLFQFL